MGLSSRNVPLQRGLGNVLSLYPQGPLGCWKCQSAISSASCLYDLTQLKSRALSRKHILISKHSNLLSIPVLSQVCGYHPTFKLWPHFSLSMRTTRLNNLKAFSRSHLGPGGFRIPPCVSGELARPCNEGARLAREYCESVSCCEWEFKHDHPDIRKETTVKGERYLELL